MTITDCVEQIHHFIMSIRTAYENGKAGRYKDYLLAEAADFGINPNVIAKMRQPILVRERVDKLDDEQKARFAKEANKSSISQLTAIEQAVKDSDYLGDLSNLQPSETGRITNGNNRLLFRTFSN